MKKVTTLFLAMAICTFSYGQEDQKMEKEKAAILEVIDQEAKRFVNLDMEGLTALHVQSESDVRLAGTQLHSGWEDIQQLLEAYMERNKQDPGLKDSWNEKENLKMKIMGNAAWVICDNIWNWKMEEETMVFRNYQISFLEKIDGEWKFSFNAFVPSSDPEPEAVQYFEASPEIDIARATVKAYLEGDLGKFRSFYSDSARIWYNQNYTKYPGMTVDELISNLKTGLQELEYYKYEGEIWEMIVQNDGDKWVHFWGNWLAKYKDSAEELEIPVHIAFGILEGKIVYESGFWDTLPFYLAGKN